SHLGRPGAPGGALGHPRGLRRLPEAVPPAAAQAHRHPLRTARRPHRLPRPGDRRGPVVRSHRRADGRGTGAAGRGPRRARPHRVLPEGRMSTDLRRVAVLGAGSWGTAFAKVMADAGREVVLWARRREIAAAVNATHANPDYLPGVELPTLITATTDAAAALADVDAVVFAVPSQQLRANLEGWRDLLPRGKTLVSLAKGVELGTLNRMSEVVAEVAGVPDDHIAVVTGPNLAREIAAEEPTATVIACADHDR